MPLVNLLVEGRRDDTKHQRERGNMWHYFHYSKNILLLVL